MSEEIIRMGSSETTAAVFGTCDAHARTIEAAFDVELRNRSESTGDAVQVTGRSPEAVRLAEEAGDGEDISEQRVAYLIGMIRDGQGEALTELDDSTLCLTSRGKPVKAKTVGQKKYVDAIRQNTVVFGVGPAGTGKTFLAVAMAVKALRAKEVSRIVLTRPAIEAGEKLGFLPGDLQSKIDPYLRPLYDAMFDLMGAEAYGRMVEKGAVEVAPLAYMRGRTLDDSFIILDEAQNTSREQMKMFLTRIGFGSHVVITGDVTQIDLPSDKPSGLKEALRILDGIDDIAICRLTGADVVRHALVQKIIAAYEQDDKQREKHAAAAAKKPAARKTTVRKKA